MIDQIWRDLVIQVTAQAPLAAVVIMAAYLMRNDMLEMIRECQADNERLLEKLLEAFTPNK